MREAWLRLRYRVGRRGSVLLILATVDVAFGASLIGPSAEDVGRAATAWRELYAPLWVWGGGWLIVAAILVVSAFMIHDEIGYVAAIAWKVLWALTTLTSWAVGGVPRGWVSSIVWAVVAAMVWVIASWPEPVRAGDDDEGHR